MYDIIVVGGGHAGIEAALAPARMNQKTVLVTSNFDNVEAFLVIHQSGDQLKELLSGK